VIDRLEKHFIVKQNDIYERAKFNSRIQDECEFIDDYITSHYSLCEYCEYGAFHDEMIRDKIVVDVRDRRLSENTDGYKTDIRKSGQHIPEL